MIFGTAGANEPNKRGNSAALAAASGVFVFKNLCHE